MRTASLVLSLLVAAPAFAQAQDDVLVEKVVVRNRLFNVEKRWEVGATLGFSLLSRLTEHYTFDATLAYNLFDWLAFELMGGYAYSRHTSLARDVADQWATNTATTANDLSDLWEMTANGLVGVRWQPLYGKIGIFAEYPIHFQFYVWLGGGVALFKRESVVICNQRAGATCSSADDPTDANGNVLATDVFFQETKVSGLLSLALGMRFFIPVVGNNHSIRVEIRDYSYLDSYLIKVNRMFAMNPANPTGNGEQESPGRMPNFGVINLVQVHIGYAYMF